MNIRFITDPGHGWIEVPMTMIDQLGIRHKISPYSYRNGSFAYLEEDCDAYEFVQACKSQGITPTFNRVYEEHTAIRSYPRFA